MSAQILSVDQATRRFAGLVAVDCVSFAMQRGEILSLIGPNGAGKTTLFNLISGQLKPSEGAIQFDGERIEALPPHARAQRGIGRTFQIAKPLIGLTARENVMVGAFLRHPRHDAAYQAATLSLGEVGLAARADEPTSASKLQHCLTIYCTVSFVILLACGAGNVLNACVRAPCQCRRPPRRVRDRAG